jgi:hypothetical protein
MSTDNDPNNDDKYKNCPSCMSGLIFLAICAIIFVVIHHLAGK